MRRQHSIVPQIVLLLLLLSWSAPPASGQSGTEFRAYRLQHVPAAGVVEQMKNVLGADGTQVEVLLDEEHNQVFVRGPAAKQQVAWQMLEAVDRPVAPTSLQTPQPSGDEVRGYQVPANQLSGLAERLRTQFANQGGVRISEDSRTSQLIVVGPAAVHAQISRMVAALPAASSQPAEPRRMPQVGARPAEPHQLRHISWRELEDALRRLAGESLQIEGQHNGEVAVIRLQSAQGMRDVMRVDRRAGAVNFLGDFATGNRGSRWYGPWTGSRVRRARPPRSCPCAVPTLGKSATPCR